MRKRLFSLLISLVLVSGSVSAEESGFKFKVLKEVEATPVKHQAKTGTCWAFATNSFIESELLRMGKGQHDISEMFAVRMVYPQKIRNFVRLHGKTQFGPGSLSGDLMRVVRQHGMLPESVYSGRHVGESRHNHQEMDAVLEAGLKALVANKSGKLSVAWPEAFEGILDAYLGKVPENFLYRGKTYTPRSFADELGIRPDDYMEFTSYTYHPFYEKFSLKVPDNWAHNTYYNLPLDEFMQVADNALESGFTVAWDGDVSEKSFHRDREIAILPKKDWEDRTKEEQKDICKAPEPELKVTQEVRQQHYDNYTSGDDHLMHATGLAEDQNGTRFYIVKNSWGTKEKKNQGSIYMSEPYFRSKAVSIMVHKDAVPAEILAKLR